MNKQITAKDTLEIISQTWCSVYDIMKLTNNNKKNSLIIMKEINQILIDQGYHVLDKYVPSDKLVEYFHFNIEYLKQMAVLMLILSLISPN